MMIPLSRVWEVAPHLCGLTSAAMRRRKLLVLKAFIDESGKSEPPVYVMGGFIASAEQWAAFNEDWRAALEQHQPIEAFHMAEAKFRGYEHRLPQFIDIIKKHGLQGIAVTVFHEDYQAAFKGKIARRMDRPYFILFYWIMVVACQWQLSENMNEKMDFVFDEQDDEAKFIQQHLSKLINEGPPEIKNRIGVLPVHMDDVGTPGLQAADILCWMLRKNGELAVGGTPPTPVIKDFFDSVPFYRDHLSAERLVQMMGRITHKNEQDLMLTEYQFEQARENLPSLLSAFNFDRINKAEPDEEVFIFSIPAKQMTRFRLLRSCDRCGNPHLHRRVGDECLGEVKIDDPEA